MYRIRCTHIKTNWTPVVIDFDRETLEEAAKIAKAHADYYQLLDPEIQITFDAYQQGFTLMVTPPAIIDLLLNDK